MLNADPSAKDFKVPDLLAAGGDQRSAPAAPHANCAQLVDEAVKNFEASESAKLMDANFKDAYRLMTQHRGARGV